MQRQRVLLAFAVAWLTALLLSWFVYQRSTTPQVERDLVRVVAATRDLSVGSRLPKDALKLVSMDRRDLPKGALTSIDDAADRTLSAAVVANEVLHSAKLAAKGSGEGLSSLIEPGMRAVSVRVNEISGVSGFVQPGTRVDVVFTRVFQNGDAAATTILQNAKVIAYGRQFDPGAARVDPADTTRPSVATLLVTQAEAEKLVLAEQRGRIQLLLRNPLDDDVLEIGEPVRSADLGIEDPQRPRPLPVRPVAVAPPVPPRPVRPVNEGRIVRIYRGDKLTQERFQ